ncbi:guanine deaminase [Anaeramoeba flamelloides]|uniref:Guanine deaminase n=1 Tax=Anaeramoeba flamelloides TaxID=1746091 RepID=A0AAV8A173_9EUKA|nr:guanine deaminase [Anaeramoeba flamelloides]KAJ6245596.1 guanine deaminase [Anaeramoeba flamelloides]
MSLITKVFKGDFFHTLGLKKFQHLSNHVLGVNLYGKIEFLKPISELDELRNRYKFQESIINDLGNGFMVPGFVDAHAHAPQSVNVGLGTDLPLLDWLIKYTFPTESKFQEADYANLVYSRFVKRNLQQGTTTTCYFGTIHLDSCKILVDLCAKYGQRAIIGKVNMNRNSPDNYIETTSDSIRDTEAFVEYVKNKPTDLVEPIITPRFVPTCDPDLMYQLGEIAKKNDLRIQSHVSENKDEVAWVKDLHPECKSYSDVYYKHGLLNDKTIMAHGVYLTDEERKLYQKVGASIAHCANSNFTLSSGCLNLRQLLDMEIKVGLGTDVSGGYASSMLQCIRDTIICSKAKSFETQDKHNEIDFREGFHLATLGSAKSIGLDHKIGNFELYKHFDALWVKTDVENGPFDSFNTDSIEDRFQKWIYLGDDRNIHKTFVNGKQVKK